MSDISQNILNANWSDKSILIVEDDKFNAFIIVSFLQKTQVRYQVVETGERAVEMALANKPDLILMDIKLPGIDGLDATRQIKNVYHDLPIIAQTAFATENDKDEAIAAGCNDFISKPIKSDVLIQIMAKYL